VIVEKIRKLPYYGVMSEDWLRGFCDGVVAMREKKTEASAMARKIADVIFECGNERLGKTTRIEFKTGDYEKGTEHSMGGLCHRALVSVIVDALRQMRENADA